MAAEKHYKALPTSPPARKLHALKEWLIICLRASTGLKTPPHQACVAHAGAIESLADTVQPPDRVGVVYAPLAPEWVSPPARSVAHSLGLPFGSADASFASV